jgi:hypothetical protein
VAGARPAAWAVEIVVAGPVAGSGAPKHPGRQAVIRSPGMTRAGSTFTVTVFLKRSPGLPWAD